MATPADVGRSARRAWLGIALVGSFAIVVGCASAASPAASGDSGQPAASAGSGSGGGTTSIGDACALLTAAEIGDALGTPMKDGVVTHTSDSSSDCSWEAQDLAKGAGLNLTLEQFDQDLWDTYKEMGPAEDPTVQIPGIGDETIRIGGVVLGGTYVVRKGNRDASFLVVAINLDTVAQDAASEKLARLIAERM